MEHATAADVVAAARAETSDFIAVKTCEAAGIAVRFIGLDHIEATAGRFVIKLKRASHG